jgi:hypothetical protein
MKNFNDVRDALADTIKGVRDGSLAIDQARCINELVKTITDTVRVESEHARYTGREPSSGFLPTERDHPPIEPAAQLPNGVERTVAQLPHGATRTVNVAK